MDENLTVGTITAMVALINRLYRPVQDLLNLQVDFTRSLALFSRIFEYFDMKSSIVSPENGLKPDVTCREIVYDHVAFSSFRRPRRNPLEVRSICYWRLLASMISSSRRSRNPLEVRSICYAIRPGQNAGSPGRVVIP